MKLKDIIDDYQLEVSDLEDERDDLLKDNDRLEFELETILKYFRVK